MTGEVISLMAQATPPGARMDDPVLRPPTTDEAEHFSDLMGSTSRTPAQQDVAPVDRVAPPPSVPTDGIRLGDKIIRSMHAADRVYTEQASRIDKFLATNVANVSPIDMLRMQWHMARASLMVDLVAKTVQKTTQHVDTLTKLQ